MSDVCPVCSHPVEPGAAQCPTCGFKLLGATQAFRPINVDEAPATEPAPQLKHGVLHVLKGPQVGVEFTLGDEPMTIGRDPKCTIFLNDMTVSRMHASIDIQDGCYILRDENSFNGVWVNNKNIEAHTLRSGDLIQIGTFCMRYRED